MAAFSLAKALDPFGILDGLKQKTPKTSSVADPSVAANAAADSARQRNLQLLSGGSPTTVFSQSNSADSSISKNTLGAT